jgi:hypothetical protein
MEKIEVLRLSSKKLVEEEKIKRKFVTVRNRKKKVSSSLKRDLLKNYGFKLVDN